MADIVNPSTPFFKWKMAIVTKSTDDWTKWNCDETYERSLFIGIHDDLENPYAALYLIYKGTVQPAAGNAILADLLALQTTVNNAVQELQALIDQVNATSASMQELWQKVNVLVAEMEDKLEDMQIQIGKAKAWAEGTDAEVTPLGGTHSSKTWAGIAKQAADLATGAAFPILAEGDQGKALVVNDTCDGYELTTITADAAEYSTNRIVRTAHEQQQLVRKYYSYSAQIYIKAGVVGWVPNGGPGYEGINTMDKIVLTPTLAAPQTVIMNNIASDTTVTAAQDLAPDDLPTRDYWALGDNKAILFTVAADGSEILGFTFDETAWVCKDRLTTVPSQFYCIFDPSTGKAWYTKDTGASWVQCSLPFMRLWFTTYASRNVAYVTFGSVLTTYFKGAAGMFYWLVPPFDCCMANGGSTTSRGVGVDTQPQMRRFKVSAPVFLDSQPQHTTENYGNKLCLWVTTNGDVAGGDIVRVAVDADVVYSAEEGKVSVDDYFRDAAIEIACCPNKDWWGTFGGDYQYSNPMLGRTPDYIQTVPGYAFGASDTVRCIRASATKALSDAETGTIVMENNNGLRVYVAPSAMNRCAENWRQQWTDISPASAKSENEFTSTNTFKSWTYLEGQTSVCNGGYLSGHGASWFTVPNPSKDKNSEEYPYEAINRGTMTSAIALATSALEPRNEDASLTPAPSFYSQWTEYTQQTSSGAVTVHVLDKETGIASGFGANAYCYTVKTLEELGYDSSDNADIIIRFKATKQDNSEYSLFSVMGSGGQLQNFGMYYGGYGSYYGSNAHFGGTVNANVWTYVHLKMVDGLCTVEYLEDASEAYTLSTLPTSGWTQCPQTASISGFRNGELRLGHNTQDGYEFPGSIDLKNSRIKIGGITVWNGAGLVQPFAGVIETVGSSVTLDEVTGIASNFDGTSYLKFVAPSTGAYGFDFIMRVKTTDAGLNPLLAYDSTGGTVAVTDMGLNAGKPYTFQNAQMNLNTTDAVNNGEWAWVRFKKASSGTDGYVLKDPSGQYTLANLPDIAQWDKASNGGSLELAGAKVLCIGKNFREDASQVSYFHGSIDLYNTKLTVGDAVYYDGSTLVQKAYETQGIHQQSACLVNPTVLVRRFESNGKTYMELDGTFSGTVAADNTITIDTKAYSFKGTLISLQAMSLGTGTVTVNYNSTTAADLENGTITLRTSIAAGEAFSVSLHCVIAQG